MAEAKRQHPGVTICPVCTRRIIGKHKCNEPPELPWEEREESEHNDVLRPGARKPESSLKSSGECGQGDQAGRMEEAIRQARKPGHQPATAHPWRNQKPGESERKAESPDGRWEYETEEPIHNRPIYFAGFDERFDQPVGPVVQHVKDGRPLTERGAELLTVHEADAVGSHGLQGCGRNTAQKAALYPQPVTERGAELLNSKISAQTMQVIERNIVIFGPQPVVVSPSSRPPHSQQTKQVHQYQQRKQV